jgi:hypothetical protein
MRACNVDLEKLRRDQTLLPKQEHEETRPVAVICPACARLHFIDKSTGIALGQDK